MRVQKSPLPPKSGKSANTTGLDKGEVYSPRQRANNSRCANIPRLFNTCLRVQRYNNFTELPKNNAYFL